MLRSAAAIAILCVALPLLAQPVREKLIGDVRFDDEDVRPAFSTLTAQQLRDKTYVSLLEIDDGVQIVQAVEVTLPKGDNVHYATVEFEPPSARDSRGAAVPVERQSGFINPTRNSLEHRLFVPGGDRPAEFATVKGRVTLRAPLTVETHTIRAGEGDSLSKRGAVIDGPFVRYRRESVAESFWMGGMDAVRAYDAEGRRLEREGTYPDEVNGEGFEMVAFHGAPSRVEVDFPGESAGLAIDYELTYGNPKAAKVAKALVGDEPRSASVPAAAGDEAARAELARLGYPNFDVDALLAASGNGDVKAVALLLGGGIDPSARGTSGMTALHVATARSKAAAVDLLLEAGADPNATSANGLTPLFGLSARCEQVATVEKLIARGADVNAKGSAPMTPLALAKSMNCDATVSALTKAGAR